MNAEALEQFRLIVGSDRVRTDSSDFARTTIGTRTTPAAVLRPASADQIQRIVGVANTYRLPLYPISRGKNWGYGSACAPGDDQIVLDLSNMTAIEIDAELGLVTVEPGVSQQMLREALDEIGADFLVPVTGAGPDASLLGNLLERGYGITPYADHFAATTALEAVLADGSIYRTPLARLGGERVDRAFKWGIGPYADGLFTQGAFGIVTRATIALAARPEHIEAVFFSLRDADALGPAVECIRGVIRQIGAGTGGINLMNRRRILSMTEPYPADRVAPGQIIPDDLLEKMARRHKVTPWTGVAVFYGSRTVVRAARRLMRQRLRELTRRFLFVSPKRLSRVRRLVSVLPGPVKRKPMELIETLEAAVRNFSGAPSEIALPLAYWRGGRLPEPGVPFDPARDGCGLIWYSPLVPMTAVDARAYADMVERVCRTHRIEPLITLTTLNDRVFDSTVPLLFDAADPDETARARACYDALFDEGCKLGYVPYRVGITAMDKVVDTGEPYWRMIEAMKRAVDPNYIIAPGRYCPPAPGTGRPIDP